MELESVKQGNLSSLVKENLKLYFVKNNLKGGDPIPTEHELAQGLNVSRTAVREALKSLESLGIIEVRPGVGRFLKSFNFDAILENLGYGIDMDVDDFKDILDVRIVLEGAYLERYAGRYGAGQIKELRDILDAMSRLESEGAGESAMIQMHTLFHLTLYKNQGNALLLSLIKIFATIQRSMAMVNRYRTQDTRKFIELHSTLVDALERADVVGVKMKLLEHFEEALEWSRNAIDRPSRPSAEGIDITDRSNT